MKDLSKAVIIKFKCFEKIAHYQIAVAYIYISINTISNYTQYANSIKLLFLIVP
jgi:hypothetical protein